MKYTYTIIDDQENVLFSGDVKETVNWLALISREEQLKISQVFCFKQTWFGSPRTTDVWVGEHIDSQAMIIVFTESRTKMLLSYNGDFELFLQQWCYSNENLDRFLEIRESVKRLPSFK